MCAIKASGTFLYPPPFTWYSSTLIGKAVE
jgi:hypothetical protein